MKFQEIEKYDFFPSMIPLQTQWDRINYMQKVNYSPVLVLLYR